MRYGEGYIVWATEAESRQWGLVMVFWREEVRWQVEGIVNFGLNVVSFLLTTG